MNFAEQMKKTADDVMYKRVNDVIEPVFEEIDRVINMTAQKGLFCLYVSFRGTTIDGVLAGEYANHKNCDIAYNFKGFKILQECQYAANMCIDHYKKEGFNVQLDEIYNNGVYISWG